MSLEPVTVTVTVDCDAESAFRLWTKELATWWPFDGHSLGGDAVVDVVFEEWVGGRMYEVWRDGTERTWAEIEAWDPPHGLALAWHPGSTGSDATHVELSFTTRADGTTEVRLVHHGWDGLGDGATERRASYADGWATVLGRFHERASSTP